MALAATVYLAKNKVTGDSYVGVTRFSPKARWTQHQYHAKTHPRTYFHRAIAKYGADAFEISSVASCLSIENASAVEREVIKSISPTYNQTNGGEITVGKRVPRHVVEVTSAKNKGKKRTPEHNAAMSAIKKQQYIDNPNLKAMQSERLAVARMAPGFWEKLRAGSSKASRERVWSDESRAKLSASQKGRKGNSAEAIALAAAKNKKKVECLTLGMKFESASDAAAAFGFHIAGVSQVCLGKRNSIYGLIFKYI